MEYIAKYKCDYCGATFDVGITGNEQLAFKSIIMCCVNKPTLETFPFNEPHITKEHYGIGHLIGVEIKRGETDGEQ